MSLCTAKSICTPVPLLIAKDRNAKICKDDFKVGWLQKSTVNKDWIWIVFGSCANFAHAKKCCEEIVQEKGDRFVYYSVSPLSCELEAQMEELELTIVHEPAKSTD
jgi:hypothetical protein